jgi:hypothetical protein
MGVLAGERKALAHLVADPSLEAPRATPPADGGSADAGLSGDLFAGEHAGGYHVASVPALRGCHTQATSLDDLLATTGAARTVIHPSVLSALGVSYDTAGIGVEPRAPPPPQGNPARQP